MGIVIRPATPEELPVIVRQRHAMFEAMGYVNRAELDLTDIKFEEWVRDKLRDGRYRGWFAVDEQGRIAGGIGLWLMEYPPHAIDQSTRRGHILNVYTAPEFQNVGVTHQLAVHVLDFCRDNGIRTVVVNPSDLNRPLFEALGFRPTGELKIQLAVPN